MHVADTLDGRDTLLTEKQLADRWSWSASSLANQRHQGRGVPFIRIGERSIRYRLSDVLAYEQRVDPQDAAA